MAIAPNPKEGITNPLKKEIRLPKNVSAMTTAVNTGRKIIHNNPLSTRPQYICPKPGINKDKIAAIPFEWSPIMVLLTLIVFKVYRLPLVPPWIWIALPQTDERATVLRVFHIFDHIVWYVYGVVHAIANSWN